MGAFDDLIPGNAPSSGGGMFDDLIPQRTVGQELGRQAGRTVRHVAEGAAGLASPFANALGGIWNQKVAAPIGLPRMGTDAVGAVAGLLDSMGLPRDEGGLEEFTGAVNRAAVGGGGTIAGARAVGGQAANVLGSNAGAQFVGATAGSGAADIARQSGADPISQLAIGLIAGSTPAVVHGVGSAATRGAIRGGEEGRQQFNQRMVDFWNAGIKSPTAGQAAGNRRTQAAESVLSRAPGGAGVMVRHAEQEADEMAARVAKLADDVMPSVDATKAGLTVEKGLKDFVGRFKADQNILYGKLDALIPKQTAVNVSATRDALKALNADIPNAPKLSEWFKNAKIQGIEEAFKADAPNAQLPYEALQKLRTLVGNEISNSNLVSVVPRDKWKALYAALSDDMGAAAQAAGPDAERAFARANAYTRAGYTRIESVLDRVSGKDTPEKIFLAAVNPTETKEGATTINAVMRSLNPEERKAVTAATIRRMGQATPGNQNEAGDVFSSQTFLTNWNKVSDKARLVLFPDAKVRQGLDDLALAASRIKEGSKVFANPSGTAQQGMAQGTAGGAVVAAATGNLPVVGGILAGLGASYGSAKLMTNPRFLQWVGKTTRMPAEALPTQLNFLAQQARNWPDEERQAVDEFIRATGQGQ